MTSYAGRVLVYGGKGALGSSVVKHFTERSWWVGSIDVAANSDASVNVVVDVSSSWTDQESTVNSQVLEALGSDKIDAILCVAGGWAGGNTVSKNLVKNSDLMWKQSVWTSVLSAELAAKHLKEGGTLVLTGAHAALSATPGSIGYGMAKAAVHHLVKSLTAPKSGLPNNTFVSAILPVTLDTPMNRQSMPKADFSKWTPLETVADLLYRWSSGVDRPASGSLVQLLTNNGVTDFLVVDEKSQI